MLLHRNLVANVLAGRRLARSRCVDVPPPVEQLIIVTALPLYHIFALTGVLPVRRAQRRRCAS